VAYGGIPYALEQGIFGSVSGKNFCNSGNVIIEHGSVRADAQPAQSMTTPPQKISVDVRFAPNSDRNADIAEGPLGANSGLMHCSK
jgi:hypothetical protein